MVELSDLEQCCQLVIAAGLSTGHADNVVDLMREVLDQFDSSFARVRETADSTEEEFVALEEGVRVSNG